MERDIIFENLNRAQDLFKLKEHLRELYRLVDNRLITITRAASITLDTDEGEVFYIELDGNITGITIKNPYQGRKITVIFKQDGSGSHTVAGWAATVMLAGDAFSVTSTANRYTTITFIYDGTNWVEVGRTTDVY